MSLSHRFPLAIPLFVLFGAPLNLAQAQNTSQLSQNGWYADDMRADGLGTQLVGTNLVSPTLTANPEGTAAGNPAHNTDILRQVSFGPAPGSPPVGTHRGAVHLIIGPGALAGKSQLSSRKDDGIGHATGLSAFGSGMTMSYSWLGSGTAAVTPAIKFGVQTADFATIWTSGRTGENAWDKLMVYEPSVGNGQLSDGLWHTETVDFNLGQWWLFDRSQISGTSATPMTLAQMSTSATLLGTQTIASIYAKMTAPGALISSVQVGVGVNQGGADVYVNELSTNFFRPGRVTTFGEPVGNCDQNLTSNVLFGNGVANGAFTVDRNVGVELGLRAKVRFNASNLEENTFHSNGDGTYTLETGFPSGAGLPIWASNTTPRWNLEWSVNTNYDGTALNPLNALTYEVGLDFDPSPGTQFLVFDPIAADSVIPYTSPTTTPFWDHAIGLNGTASGSGNVAADQANYLVLLSANNVAQNSWNMENFNLPPFDGLDPWVEGSYDFYLAAFDAGVEVARASITVLTENKQAYSQTLASNVIMGPGITNGSFSTTAGKGIELALRGKLRFNALDLPENTFNSNGDGTYTFQTGTPAGGAPWVAPSTPLWNIEWSVNTDVDGTSGLVIDDYTYEIGMDFHPGVPTDYLAFDPITANSTIPFTTPVVAPFWDHAFGTNATLEGGGALAGDLATYQGLTAGNNLVQNTWNLELFNQPPFDIFSPTAPGRYDFYLAATDLAGVEAGRAEMTMIVLNGSSLLVEAELYQSDHNCNFPGRQVKVNLYQRNLTTNATGFQAFLNFDSTALIFEAANSSYSPGPYGVHIQSMATAEVAPGQLRLDGSAGFGGGTGSAADFLLATLEFTAINECTPAVVSFDISQPFGSELSFQGTPIVTATVNHAVMVPDASPPVLANSPDILVAADASVGGGCASAVVTFPLPAASDTCSGVTVECFPPSGTAFPAGQTTKVTCVATDLAGNFTTNTFNVTVTSTNLVLVDLQLVGVTTATTRCIEFITDSCSTIADVDLIFDANGRFNGLVEVPCGTWTSLCAKDRQHTTWANQPLSLSLDGTFYTAGSQYLLLGGDTDDDGDIDINDVTWFMFQFGGLANSGGCPWDGTRDADFSNNGAVGSEDFTFLTSNWLSVSGCNCSLPFGNGRGAGNGAGRARRRTQTPIQYPWQARLDSDGNRRIDHRDVRAFELANDLPHTLSEAIRATAAVGRR